MTFSLWRKEVIDLFLRENNVKSTTSRGIYFDHISLLSITSAIDKLPEKQKKIFTELSKKKSVGVCKKPPSPFSKRRGDDDSDDSSDDNDDASNGWYKSKNSKNPKSPKTFPKLKNDINWRVVDVPQDLKWDDDIVMDTNFDDSPSKKQHSIQERSTDFSGLQAPSTHNNYANDYDNFDDAGPSNAEPPAFLDSSTKRSVDDGVDRNAQIVKRARWSAPRKHKNENLRRTKMRARDIKNARILREVVRSGAMAAAREKVLGPIPELTEDEDKPQTSGVYGLNSNNKIPTMINLVSGEEGEGEEGEEFVSQSGFRTTEKRRKPHAFQRNKTVRTPPQSVEKKLLGKFGLSPRIPKKHFIRRKF